ncbi:MAG: SPL family radical SAM protein [Planctomycetota bacterium]|jgi:DNA repair photolyase
MPIIYKPSGRAAEYSHLAINHYIGCGHGCRYCYGPAATKIKKNDFHKKQSVRKDVLRKLRREAPKYAGTDKRVLLSFITDPYQPLDETEQVTRKVIELLREFDIPFQILTKGGTRACRDFDLYGTHDLFSTTLTFLNEQESRREEPNAAIPRSRILALEMAKKLGIETWVSLEPVIDTKQTLEIIRQTHRFVDHYKIGKLNYDPRARDINWRKFGIAAIELCRDCKTDYYIKDDLAMYLDGIAFHNVDKRTVNRAPGEKRRKTTLF